MANTINVGILGLRRLGGSVGLALKRYAKANAGKQGFSITGFDTNTALSDAAKARGAIDGIARSPEDAANGKDVIILALPLGEVEEALRLISRSVRDGAVILEWSPLKSPALDATAKLLSPNVHLVGLNAILNPAYLFDGIDDFDHAQADLFDKGLILLAPSAHANKDAVELAANFADILGAQTRFTDPAEHDAWQSALEALPALVGYAAFHMLRTGGTWADMQRMGNPSFGRLTHHLQDMHPSDVRDLLLHNRTATVEQIDALIETLEAFRGAIAANDRAALDETFEADAAAYQAWWAKRRTGKWDDTDTPESARTSDTLVRGMLGGYLSDRLRGKKG